MKIIPPAEVFIINKQTENRPPTPKQVEEWLIEFARMHVNEALKQSSEKATYIRVGKNVSIVKSSILNAYSLKNIE